MGNCSGHSLSGFAKVSAVFLTKIHYKLNRIKDKNFQHTLPDSLKYFTRLSKALSGLKETNRNQKGLPSQSFPGLQLIQ